MIVLAGISVEYKTDLHVIEGSLTGLKYQADILHPNFSPIAGAVGKELIFIDDNSRPIRARKRVPGKLNNTAHGLGKSFSRP